MEVSRSGRTPCGEVEEEEEETTAEKEEKVYSIKAIIENCRTDVRKLIVIDSLLLPRASETPDVNLRD